METVLITGATGFLGARAAKLLAEKGYSVTGLGRNLDAGKKLESLGIHFVACDLNDRDTLARAFEGQDFVIHCAALSSVWGRREDFYQANVEGTARVIQACRSAMPRRLIHISTPSIYIDSKNRENILESDPLPKKSINFYAETKLLAEREIDRAAAVGLPVITLRPQGIFGPEDPHILPRLLRLAKKGVLPRIAGGRARIDLTYIDNVVEAIERAMLAEDRHLGKKYNISNGSPVESYSTLFGLMTDLGFHVRPFDIPYPIAVRTAEFLEFMHRILLSKSEPVLTRYSVFTLAYHRTLSIEAAKNDLGYYPNFSMEEGLLRTVEAYRRTVK